MKKLLVIAVFSLFAVISLQAQTDCPVDRVCLTRSAALKALEDADAVVALRAEIKAKDAAYSAQKDLLNEMRAEFSRVSGENTILKQRAVSDLALIELFSKQVRPKRIGLINIF